MVLTSVIHFHKITDNSAKVVPLSNINRDSGTEIPEAWIPTIRKHNRRPERRQTA